MIHGTSCPSLKNEILAVRYMVIARGRVTRRGTCRCEGGVDEAEGNVKRHSGTWRVQVVVVVLLEKGGIVRMQQ